MVRAISVSNESAGGLATTLSGLRCRCGRCFGRRSCRGRCRCRRGRTTRTASATTTTTTTTATAATTTTTTAATAATAILTDGVDGRLRPLGGCFLGHEGHTASNGFLDLGLADLDAAKRFHRRTESKL